MSKSLQIYLIPDNDLIGSEELQWDSNLSLTVCLGKEYCKSHHEISCLWGFQVGPTQTMLYSQRS